MPRRRDVPDVPLWHRVTVNASEAAALCGHSDQWIRDMVRDGHIPTVPHCAELTIAVESLRRWARGEAA